MSRLVTQDAEAVDDLVWYEVGVLVTGTTVLGIVVSLTALDVVGECARHR